MDYEKKYKEALEKARQLCAYPTTKPFISDLQDLFPELKESDDEKTRKRIIALVNTHGQGMYKDDMLAWLEKQGQKETKETFVWHEYNDKIDLNRPFLLISQKGQLSIMLWNGRCLKSVTFEGGGGIILEGDRFAYIDDLQKQGRQKTDKDMIESLRTEYEKGRADVIADTLSWLANVWPQYCSNPNIIDAYKEGVVKD